MTPTRSSFLARSLSASVLISLWCSSAWSQAFNIDLGDFNSWPVPTSTYAAGAGQPGHWHPIQSDGTLTDVNGVPTAVQMTFVDVNIPYYADSACTTGDDEALFDDFYYTPATGGSVTFTGLADGDYLLYTYAVATDGPNFITNVDVPSSPDPLQGVGGDLCNGFILGVTHALHHVTVAGAPVVVEFTVGSNYTSINGFQIVPTSGGLAFCFGDGSGSVCPCGNTGAGDEGCANSTGAGSAMVATGTADLSNDTIAFDVVGAVPDQPGLFFQGLNAINNGDGVIFGDGLRCVGGSVVRLEVAQADSSGHASSTVAVSTVGGVSAGDVRRYQYWYRDPNLSPCGTGFNLSNGVELVWQ